MLISRKPPRRFIFVHVYKTGGTSIRRALVPYIDRPWRRALNRVARALEIKALTSRSSRPYPPHITAAELVAALGKEEFESYYSFAFVRNPWDWNVSLYTYSASNPRHPDYERVKAFRSFEEFLRWRCIDGVALQRDFVLSRENEPLVDFIGRYERLEEDFRHVCAAIGIPARLPHVNASKARPYQEYYTPRTIELVRETFAEDIRIFNYAFEGEACRLR
jgi:hypothetical protein